MYYYIFESAKSSKTRSLYEKIRSYIVEYGIGGEIAVASPARTAEELTQMGLEKGYTTFVAVGSDHEVNRVLTVLQNSPYAREIAFGVVPTNPESTLNQLIKAANVREACEALKYRRVISCDLAFIEPNRFFLTPAHLAIKGPTKIDLTADWWQIVAYVDQFTVFPDLTIEFTAPGKQKYGKRFMSWLLGHAPEDRTRSVFHPKTVLINSPKTLGLAIDNILIAKTPLTIYRKQNVLRLIVKRDKIVTDNAA